MTTILVLVYPFGVIAAFIYYVINYAVFTRRLKRRNRAVNAGETAMLVRLLNPEIILPERDYYLTALFCGYTISRFGFKFIRKLRKPSSKRSGFRFSQSKKLTYVVFRY